MVITKLTVAPELGDKKVKCPECKRPSYVPVNVAKNILLHEAYIVECGYCGEAFRVVNEK